MPGEWRSQEFPEQTVGEDALWLRVMIDGGQTRFMWSKDGDSFADIGPVLDTSLRSDEHSLSGEFTGTFIGLTCADRAFHRKTADFDFFDYKVCTE